MYILRAKQKQIESLAEESIYIHFTFPTLKICTEC